MKIIKIISWLLIINFCITNLAMAESLFVSDDTRQQLGEAQALYEQAKYAEGLQSMQTLLKQRRLTDYEKALAYQLQAYLFAGNDQLAEAANAFDTALKFDALEESVSLNLRFNLAQILVAQEQYKKAIPQLETWLQKTKKVSTQQNVLIATTYYFAKKYQLASNYINLALQQDNKPARQNYELALAIYLAGKENHKAIEILHTALAQYPDDENFWKQLANLYRQADQQQLAVASLQTAYDAKLLQKTEIVNLAKMLFYLDTPYAAAELLKKSLQTKQLEPSVENTRLLAECLLAARDYLPSAQVFGEAARLAKDGNLYVRQAEILLEREQWSKVIAALKHAFQTETLDDEDRARILLGIANYESGNIPAAKDAFVQVSTSGKQHKTAIQWLRLISSER